MMARPAAGHMVHRKDDALCHVRTDENKESSVFFAHFLANPR